MSIEQGPVRFDENGIRHVTELQMLQYRTTYINDTPIITEDCNFTTDERLRLITVALCGKDGSINFSLDFLYENRNSIWPSKLSFASIERTLVEPN